MPYRTSAEREQEKIRRALTDLRNLAEIIHEPQRPVDEHTPVGLAARIETERLRLWEIQHARDRLVHEETALRMQAQTPEETQREITSLWGL